MYTSWGYMTPEDIAEVRRDLDLDLDDESPDEDGPTGDE